MRQRARRPVVQPSPDEKLRPVKVVLVDTGPIVDYLNGRDRHHQWAVEQFRRLRPPLLTCEGVLSEADLADACLVRMSEQHAECSVLTVDSQFRDIFRRNGRQVIPTLLPPGSRRRG
jgi:rRNA-processing protein FCF1